LEKLGVHVSLNTLVKDYDGKIIQTNHPELNFEAATVIWAAGIEGNVPTGIDDEAIEKGKRIWVDEFNQVAFHTDVYALGDVALMRTKAYPNGHPQVAPAAMQQAENIAANFKRMHKEKDLQPFTYFDKGSMATIGRNKAVVDFRNIHLKGLVAWFAWMFVHLLLLSGFRNKLVVFVNWIWSYLTYDKGTRLIIRPFDRQLSKITVALSREKKSII